MGPLTTTGRHGRRSARVTAVLAVLSMLLLLSGRAAGQGPTTGTLRGVVRDARGSLLSRALVTATDLETGIRRTVFTDRSGGFELSGLKSGDFEVLVEHVGYPPLRAGTLAVRPTRTTHVQVRFGEDGARATSLGGGLPGTSQWLPGFALRALPGARSELDEWVRLSTWSDERMGMEGLPFTQSALAIDGVPFRPAPHPIVEGPLAALLPVSGVASAEVVGNAFDVEWLAPAGALISAHSRRGTPGFSGEGTVAWWGNPIAAPGAFDAGGLEYQNVSGAALLRGSALGDSARIAVGVSLRRWDQPLSAAWPSNEVTAQLTALGSARQLELAPYRQAAVVPMDAVAGFGTLEWSGSGGHRFELSVNAAGLPAQAIGFGGRGLLESSSRDAVARATLRSQLRSGLRNTLNVSVASSRRESQALGKVRATALVPYDLSFGSGGDALVGQSTVRLLDAVELERGAHTLKLGAEVSVTSFDHSWRAGSAGSYAFGGLSEFASGQGVYARTLGPGTDASWSVPRYALLAQDRWRDGRGLELLVGARLEREKVDPGVRRDAEWAQLTWVANDLTSIGAWRLSPRMAVTWDLEREQRWLLHASAGAYDGSVDPLLVAQWKLDDGSAETVRTIGELGDGWPSAEPAPTVRGRRLTVLGPAFRAPRTVRAGGGLLHRASEATVLQLDVVYRDTRFLPRRSDLNLAASPAGRDGAGRGVFGQLVQQGGLLLGDPTTNRRFPGYDEVAAVSVDGRSRFWGATVGVEHHAASGISLLARYTYSRTRDNWFGAATGGGWATPWPTALGEDGDWTEGTSDFDLPHRAALGAVLSGPLGIRLSALYRFQSGRPFTPGFRPGVDANGDGAPGNDPAFIDPSVAGTSELFSRWGCLRERSGRLAARNSCRGEATHTLDLKAALELLQLGGAGLAVSIEALDLLEADFRSPDPALYLIDASGSIEHDAAARTNRLPLLVNPEFGQPLTRARPGRLLRIGAELTW